MNTPAAPELINTFCDETDNIKKEIRNKYH